MSAALYDDALRLTSSNETRTLLLSELCHADVERNYKLQCFFPGRMVQLSFVHGGSALQWLHAVQYLTAPHAPARAL